MNPALENINTRTLELISKHFPKDKVTPYFIEKRIAFLDKIIPKTNKEKEALDIGSNLGYFSVFLKDRGYNVSGIEPDKFLLEESKKIIKKEGYKDIEIIHGFCENLPFQNEKFDLVLCCEVLEYTSDKLKSLKEIKRILKKEGKAIITMPNVISYYFFRKALFEIIKGNWNKDYGKTAGTIHYKFPFWRTINLIKKSGLKIEKIESEVILPLEPKLIFKLKRFPKVYKQISKSEKNIKDKWPFKYLGSSIEIICTK